MSPLRPNVSLCNTEQAPYTIKNMRYCSNSQQVKLARPLCPLVDSALHILSGCQHTQIENMITERHNLACIMIFKAISKTSSLGFCFVCMDIGSSEWLAIENLQIFDTAETRIIPKWLFLPRFPETMRFTSNRADAVLVASIPARTKKQQTSNEGGWVLRSGRGQLRGSGSTSAAPPATSRFCAGYFHRCKNTNNKLM